MSAGAPALTPVVHPYARRPWLVGLALLVVGLGAVAVWRGGLLGLPPVPRGVNATRAGIADLEIMRVRALTLESARSGAQADPPLAMAGEALAMIRSGERENGFALLGRAFESAPRDLVLGNAYRMAALSLKRWFIADASRGGTGIERLPAWLAHQPLATLERMDRGDASREVTLQHALAWADEIVLFPALEIQAPANVESVKLLTALLEREPGYVPALYGRGLGYLHRPARLVWPEARKAAPDAASRDLGLAVAIGSHVGGGSARLRGTLMLALGDAYAKEGRNDHARSWWQVVENAGGSPALRAAARRRLAWPDGEMVDRLESELEARLRDTGDPLTDLSVMWR